MTMRRKTTRGASLVELLAVMSGLSVVLTTSGLLLHRAMRAHEETRRFFEAERAAIRLSNQFRRDVRSAESVLCGDDAARAGLIAVLNRRDGPEIRYERAEHGVLRTSTPGGSGAASQEVYRLSDDLRFETSMDPDSRTVEFLVTSPPAEKADSFPRSVRRTHSLRVELRAAAVLGADPKTILADSMPAKSPLQAKP